MLSFVLLGGIVASVTYSLKTKTYDRERVYSFATDKALLVALGSVGTNYSLKYSIDGVNWEDCNITLPTFNSSDKGMVEVW